MAEPIHPAAHEHLPSFITAPGQPDVLMIVMGVILALAVMAFGILFFRLHSLPERMAHRSHKIQFEIVAVLCLIALFTHMHIFWIVALLLAMIDVPDFGSSLGRIAESAEKMAGLQKAQVEREERAQPSGFINSTNEATRHVQGTQRAAGQSGSLSADERAPQTGLGTKQEELRHA